MMCLVENESAELCLGKCLWKRDVLLNDVVGIKAVGRSFGDVILGATVSSASIGSSCSSGSPEQSACKA